MARPRLRPRPRLTPRPTRGVLALGAGLAVIASLLVPTGTAVADPGPELITNGTFDVDTTGWNAYPNPSIVDGRGCIDVPAGTGPYQAGILQSVPMVAGETYAFSFEAMTEPATTSDVKVTIQGGADINYAEFLPAEKIALTPEPQPFSYTFTATQDYPEAQVTFQQDITNPSGYRLCLDDVSLRSGATAQPYEPDVGPDVRVNQLGYLPFGPKSATVVTDDRSPQTWTLRNDAGRIVASGRTRAFGTVPSAGLQVQEISFDSFTTTGSGYTLRVGDQTSYPFSIATDLYAPLRRQSKTFFYTNRSGIAIDDALEPGYGRAAGHVGVAPNQGDTAVGCLPLGDDAQKLYATPWTCQGTRDVSGGWYDAGDHGKYVVNGGIAVAQLMMEYERTQTGHADPAAYADGTLAIPEAGNGTPDLLDEIRWELSWLLRMQVPAGQQYAGMANHKVADADWTGLPLLPADDPQQRFLFRPSTAATLNLAAAAAQGARLFRRSDPAFARQLLRSASTAYAAAVKTPELYAPAADATLDPNPGSGPYDDDDVSDEFYWAAAELYLTTGEQTYAAAVQASPHNTGPVFDDGGFDWGHVAGLGRLDLATVPSDIPHADRIRASVLGAADRYAAIQAGEGFGQAYRPDDGDWVWGSNSAILNIMQVLGTAYDLSGQRKYAEAVLGSMDYLLGRNALDRSYVTGYGTVYSENEHTRWYAASLDSSLPHPPPGTIAGGPNSTTTTSGDPVSAAMLQGCVSQFCYIDRIGSFSTNEITVNWNAPLSWVAGFLAGLPCGPARIQPGPGPARAGSTVSGSRQGGEFGTCPGLTVRAGGR